MLYGLVRLVSVPRNPRIYHIVHVDRLPSIIDDGFLWCDAEISRSERPGTAIGMIDIKQRRLEQVLSSHRGLRVGDCVPFYFCPRSVMLYMISKQNHPELSYRGGQEPIVHLEADLRRTVAWAKENGQRWAFTLSNAGALYFEDRCDLGELEEVDWEAIQKRDWQQHKEGKQAEFLIEKRFPWELVSRIGVYSRKFHQSVVAARADSPHRPDVEVKPEWYY